MPCFMRIKPQVTDLERLKSAALALGCQVTEVNLGYLVYDNGVSATVTKEQLKSLATNQEVSKMLQGLVQSYAARMALSSALKQGWKVSQSRTKEGAIKMVLSR